MFKSLGAVFLSGVLLACSAPPLRTAPSPVAAHTQNPLPPAGNYAIDPALSEVRVLVYRAGPLASFGHNHVMVNRALAGCVTVGESFAASQVSIHVPVAQFVVDETAARREEGAEFPGEISEDAKTGTLHNMLSPAVLNAAAYPEITVKSVGLADSPDGLTATLQISVAGHDSIVTAPLLLHSEANRLSATGSFDVRQTALGLTPYSLMRGALQVQDGLSLKFKITAVRGR